MLPGNYSLIMLCLRLSASIYMQDQLEKEDVDIIHKSSNNYRYFPVYAVCSKDDSLFITIRGSGSDVDWATAFDFEQENHNISGKDVAFHSGFYKTAMNVLNVIGECFDDCSGTIYFTGHSYGGSVATVLCALASDMYKNKSFQAITFGAAPSMSELPEEIENSISSFIMANDIVPVLSIGNLYNHLLYKSHSISNTKETMKNILKYAKRAQITIPGLSKSIRKNIRRISKEIAKFDPQETHVWFPSGNIYQLSNKITQVTLEKVTAKTSKELSFKIRSFVSHDIGMYYLALSKLKRFNDDL